VEDSSYTKYIFLTVLNFKANDFQIKPYTTPFAIKPKERFSGGQYNMIVNAINCFASLGGFDKIRDLLKWELKP
jgi:hypothetical protein